jgi:DNA-binding beta-propeller fold protein YncE
MNKKASLLLLAIGMALNSTAAPPKAGKAIEKIQRLLYVTDKTGISVYDINDGHQLLRRIDIPDSGGYKGISASPQLGKLYVTSYLRDELICIDLLTDQIVWRKKYGKYADSSAITPDGKTLYVPFREEDSWWVINASDGAVITKIPVAKGKNYDVNPIGNPVGAHNTWPSPDGKRMYFEVLTVPYVFIADTATNKVIGKVGPFSKGVRPFAVTDDETRVFASVDGFLGFEIGAGRTGSEWGGKMLQRVEAHTPPERLAQITNPPAHKPHSTPSHGVNITPDQKEVWMVDGVYGYVYAYDVTVDPPKLLASVPLFKDPKQEPHPGWITFSIDGKYAYPDGGGVIDTKTKKTIAWIPLSEKLLEVDFLDGKPSKAGHR